MSDENRDSTTGQYTPAEPAFGREGVEREAGYVPFKEETAADDGELSVAEAAEQLGEQCGTAEVNVRTYSAIDDLPENVTLTAEQASKMLTDERAAAENAAAEAEAEKIRNEVDELRGVKPEAEAKAAEPEPQPVKEGELDPEIERALTNPKIQAVLSAQTAEYEAARQQHLEAANGAVAVAQAAFMSQFPEFAHIPAENLGAAIQAMQQQDPARAAQIAATIQRTAHIFEQQKAANQQEEHAKQTKFAEYVKVENTKFDTLVKGESPEFMKAVPALIQEALAEYGVDAGEFAKLLGGSDALLRSAAAQRLLVDAAKYRQIAKAPKAIATRALPPVQKPGARQPSVSSNEVTIQSLERQFDRATTTEQQLRLAARISGLKRTG